jgi:hypothetical protein
MDYVWSVRSSPTLTQARTGKPLDGRPLPWNGLENVGTNYVVPWKELGKCAGKLLYSSPRKDWKGLYDIDWRARGKSLPYTLEGLGKVSSIYLGRARGKSIPYTLDGLGKVYSIYLGRARGKSLPYTLEGLRKVSSIYLGRAGESLFHIPCKG